MTRLRLGALFACIVLAAGTAHAVIPDAAGVTPVLGAETAVGSIVRSAAAPVSPAQKVVDGNVDDWIGDITRLGGTAIYSAGEYVYQDYLMDDWGADDGFDAGRLATLDLLKEAEPRTYRVDALQQAAGAQFDADRPVGASLNYGDAALAGANKDQADIEEARVAADANNLYFLVRTTGMTSTVARLLILLDTEPGGSFAVPGGLTTAAEWAIPVTPDRDHLVAWYKGEMRTAAAACCPRAASWDVAYNSAGYTNAIEFSFARDTLEALSGPLPATVGIGIATGVAGPSDAQPFADVATGDAKSDLVNVAFRREPARIWMDREQALALRDGNIDRYLAKVDLAKLATGYSESYQQLPGYYERVYVTDSIVNQEREDNSYFQGAFQHYGVYLPAAYRPGTTFPAMFWMHYRGGHAHDAAAWVPGILRQFGDDLDSIVITPSARGTSSWYTGKGMEDFLDVWDDAMAGYSIDDSRVRIGGHSMGGWASWLLGLLFPDRWAAANPEDGLLVPGLWAGVGEPSDAQDGADIEAEFLVPFIGNAANLPYAILHGTEDELCPVTGAIAAANDLHRAGYQYRAYLFHAYEHYSAPIWDDWRDVAQYMSQFRRDPNPARVKYTISPALDHAVSTVRAPAGVDLGYRFDRAYWVSDLRTRLAGIDPSNRGTIDATTWGRGVEDVLAVPEAGTAGQAGVYTMHGQRWVHTGMQAAANRFAVSLTNLSSAALDVSRMGLATAQPMTASITTDGPVTLHLRGTWAGLPSITGGGSVSTDAGGIAVTFAAAGTYNITLTP